MHNFDIGMFILFLIPTHLYYKCLVVFAKFKGDIPYS
jgi:hypothetical protein